MLFITWVDFQVWIRILLIVHTGADIDTLLVAPRHIDRADFFTSFKTLLENTSGVSNVRVCLYTAIVNVLLLCSISGCV